jgi:hypothetical protein
MKSLRLIVGSVLFVTICASRHGRRADAPLYPSLGRTSACYVDPHGT